MIRRDSCMSCFNIRELCDDLICFALIVFFYINVMKEKEQQLWWINLGLHWKSGPKWIVWRTDTDRQPYSRIRIGGLLNSIIWACFFCIPCYDYWAVVRGQDTPILQVSQYYYSTTITTILQVSHSEGSFPLHLVSYDCQCQSLSSCHRHQADIDIGKGAL